MRCQECGFELSPLDKTCPRCEWLKTQPQKLVTQTLSSPYPSVPAKNKSRIGVTVLVAFTALIGGIGIGYVILQKKQAAPDRPSPSRSSHTAESQRNAYDTAPTHQYYPPSPPQINPSQQPVNAPVTTQPNLDDLTKSLIAAAQPDIDKTAIDIDRETSNEFEWQGRGRVTGKDHDIEKSESLTSPYIGYVWVKTTRLTRSNNAEMIKMGFVTSSTNPAYKFKYAYQEGTWVPQGPTR